MPGYERDHIAAGLRAAQHREIAAEAVAALGIAGIPVLLLKGISYGGWLYADPAERPMTDVDLMVPAGEHARAVDVLAALGYVHAGPAHQRSPRHHAMSLKRPHAAIDLHRGPTQRGRTAIDDALWARALPAPWVPGALHPALVDETLVHVALLARQDLIGPAILHVDAGRLLRRLDAAGRELLVARADDWRMRRVLASCLAVIEHVVGWRAARPPPWLPDRAEILHGAPPTRGRQLIRKALLVEGPRELAALALATVDGWRRSRSDERPDRGRQRTADPRP